MAKNARSERAGRAESDGRRQARIGLVQDLQHYEQVMLRALSEARVSVWIGTANVKDIQLEAPIGTRARARGQYLSITERLTELVRRNVEVRILHGGIPSRPFRESLARCPELVRPRFEMRHCPRVHLKMIAVDGAYLYLGSANFTGRGSAQRARANATSSSASAPTTTCCSTRRKRASSAFGAEPNAVNAGCARNAPRRSICRGQRRPRRQRRLNREREPCASRDHIC